MNNKIAQAVKIMRNGGVIVFPTDTAFGIGCRVDDKQAVERVIAIKGRPKNKAMPILACDESMVKDYVEIPHKNVDQLMDRFWPGGLTIILPTSNNNIDTNILHLNTVGIRIPDHTILRKVIKEVGVPIVGSSANFSGERTPFSIQDLDSVLLSKVDFVLDGECGGKIASTVIDCTQRPWRILRKGAVHIDINEYM